MVNKALEKRMKGAEWQSNKIKESVGRELNVNG